MSDQFSRTELLIGKASIEKLNKAKVAIFGIGGVGSFVLASKISVVYSSFSISEYISFG